ncbi:MAG: endonuclease/exonuclease/phosphatase family protein [Aestuariivirga sp.]|uniref:endonuclease/exonuclease/phosphatase family protein n=1 Tax=Aestuariivirga sp. TaxID=2650926 RepID=UPI0025BB6B54|nr:endonuclease/exonuclease/phosphatase family protein [Aestuariivirga sp.]MCA3561543.1 endonuclease/exonuclease/phosphatase family protein [Aestuariivirga sp.]
MKHIVPALRRNLTHAAGREPAPKGQKRPTHDGHEPALTISVASYNVHKCVGTDGVFNPGRVLNVVLELGADIVALQEADQRFGSRKGLLDLKALYEKGGYRSVLDQGSRKLSHGWHGNVILYRETAGNVANVHKMTLPGFEPRGAVLVDFEFSGLPLRIIGAHLGLLKSSRARQAEAILHAAHPVDDRAVILLGDTNEWRTGGRSALRPFDPHLSDVDMTIASFPSRFPLWPLDRVLTNRHVTVYEMQAVETELSRIASDHLPVRAVIGVTRGIAAAQGGA